MSCCASHDYNRNIYGKITCYNHPVAQSSPRQIEYHSQQPVELRSSKNQYHHLFAVRGLRM